MRELASLIGIISTSATAVPVMSVFWSSVRVRRPYFIRFTNVRAVTVATYRRDLHISVTHERYKSRFFDPKER